MASGVKVCDTTVTAFNEMKMKKNTRYMILHVDAGFVKVQSVKEKDPSKSQEEEFNHFLSELPNDIGRYCLLDLKVTMKNGSQNDILYLITWCPMGAGPKSHILYTTTKKALRDKVGEGLIDIQANDLSDLEFNEIVAKGTK